MASKNTSNKLSPEEQALVQRQKLVDALLNAQFQLTGLGTTFQMGQDINPKYADVVYCLNRLWVLGYAEEYTLMPPDVPVEKLGTELTKEVTAWLVPLLIAAVERKVLAGTIDILSPSNHSLVFLMDVMGWYWHHSLGGPKPAVNLLIQGSRIRHVVQNAALTCPLCFSQFKPSTRCKTQEAKMWEYVVWLPTHCVEYHFYHPGAKVKSWVSKAAFKALTHHDTIIKKYRNLK